MCSASGAGSTWLGFLARFFDRGASLGLDLATSVSPRGSQTPSLAPRILAALGLLFHFPDWRSGTGQRIQAAGRRPSPRPLCRDREPVYRSGCRIARNHNRSELVGHDVDNRRVGCRPRESTSPSQCGPDGDGSEHRNDGDCDDGLAGPPEPPEGIRAGVSRRSLSRHLQLHSRAGTSTAGDDDGLSAAIRHLVRGLSQWFRRRGV